MGHSLFSSILCPPLNPLSPYILYSYFVYNRVRAHVADRETPTPAACLCLRHKSTPFAVMNTAPVPIIRVIVPYQESTVVKQIRAPPACVFFPSRALILLFLSIKFPSFFFFPLFLFFILPPLSSILSILLSYCLSVVKRRLCVQLLLLSGLFLCQLFSYVY